MSRDELDRRRFNHLAAAALGGMMAGASLGCQSKDPGAGAGGSAAEDAPGGDAVAGGDKHLCRGLNDCKGQGAGGENACRGQGQCATYEHHSCAGENACKGQGGCGENPGLNACKGQGGCSVPLMDSAWETVRARKEEAWTSAGDEFAAAPPAKE